MFVKNILIHNLVSALFQGVNTNVSAFAVLRNFLIRFVFYAPKLEDIFFA